MTAVPTDPSLLFSFGTLLDPRVQASVFGGPVPSTPAALSGHDVVDVPIEDPDVVALSGLAVHRGLARREGAEVPGAALELTDEQLAAADAYEVEAYVRRRVLLVDGRPAWAYVAAHPLTAASRVGVVGDSIAHGQGDPDGGWAGLLARHHRAADRDHRLFELAIPGETLLETAERAPAELRRRRVDTAIVSAGVNDLDLPAAERPTAARLVEVLEGLCADLEAAGDRPVVLTPTWLDPARAEGEADMRVSLAELAGLRARILGWGARTHRDVVDVWPVLEERTELLGDGVHPTPAGYATLWAALRPAAV